MIEELEKLIEFIQKEYNELTNKWEIVNTILRLIGKIL